MKDTTSISNHVISKVTEDVNNIGHIDMFTIIACLIIFYVFVMALIYLLRLKTEQIKKHKRWIEQIPGLISTLGVLGTFVGITKGLMFFNTDQLNDSIPILLNGMKTAFFTSLLGMVGSLILNRIVAKKLGNIETIPETEKAAKAIVDALYLNNKKTNESLQQLGNTITSCDVLNKISIDIEQMKDDIEEIKGLSQKLTEECQEINTRNNQIKSEFASIKEDTNEELSRLRAILLTMTATSTATDNNIDTILSKINEYLDKRKENIDE